MPGGCEGCKVIERQWALHASQVSGGEFFHCRRAVRLDYPQGLTGLVVGIVTGLPESGTGPMMRDVARRAP